MWIVAIILCLIIAIATATLFAVTRKQLSQIQKSVGSKVTPLWRAAWESAQAILTHPHPYATDMDALMKEANLELDTKIPMPEEQYAKLEQLLIERIASKEPSIRKNEAAAAMAYPFLRQLALQEGLGLLKEQQVQMIKSEIPQDQSVEDKQDMDNA